jgi:hypothetical protein
MANDHTGINHGLLYLHISECLGSFLKQGILSPVPVSQFTTLCGNHPVSF